MKVRAYIIFIMLFLGLSFWEGCKLFTKYEIEGTWTIVKTVNNKQETFAAVFSEYSAYNDSGWVQIDSITYGTYRVEYETEVWFIIYFFLPGSTVTGHKATFKGGFDSASTMSGTVEEIDVAQGYEASGTWKAVKQSDDF